MNPPAQVPRRSATAQLCIKAPPELGDGDHWTIYKLDELTALSDAIRSTLDDGCIEGGESIVLQVVSMTQEELDALPDI